MKRPLMLISLSLCLAAPFAAASGNAPSWVMEGSRFDKGTIISVGVGDPRLAALVRAVADMAKMKKTLAERQPGKDRTEAALREQRVSNKFVDTADEKFGPMAVRQRNESRMSDNAPANGKSSKAFDALAEEFGDEPSDAQVVSSDVHFALKSGKKSLVVDMKLKSVTSENMSSSHESADVEIHSKDVSVADLVQELKKEGFEVRRWADPEEGTEYAGLTMKVPEGMSTEGLADK